MGKITNEELQEALEAFASALGLDYSPYREELDGGKIKDELLPDVDDTLKQELTQETKEKPCASLYGIMEYYYGCNYYKKPKPEMEATILGKINAIAEHLGIDFEVQPEKVVTTPTRVKAVKRTTTKKTPVKAVKKGKK